jgi:NAD(P)-dependent dehydrogenase (short-subunit alcohol dehydrogenase family)
MKNSKRTVAVTGGSLGIGRAIAEAFLANGDRVAVLARRRTASLPSSILQIQGDVRSRADLARFCASAARGQGPLKVFVNCAGLSLWRPLKDLDESFVREMIDINVLGTLWGCQAAAARMGRGGVLINVSSLAGKRGSANNSVYCATKFAVNGITQSLSKELGSRGIRVNAVCPVYVKTAALLRSLTQRDSPAQGAPVGKYLAEFSARQTALQRLPQAKEVAQTVLFLAGPAASAVTGQCVNVDCGVLPQ